MNYIWEIVLQALFYASAIIYPLAMVIDKSPIIAKLILLNPVAQAVQDVRYTLISHENPTLLGLTHGNFLIAAIPVLIVIAVTLFGAWLFKKRSPYFAEDV
jgi:ABC-2 type transport system permease protein